MKHEPGMAYDTKTLNKVFAVLSLIFLVSVVWIMLDDFIRPWKGFQIKALEIKRKAIAKQVKELEKKIDSKEVANLKLKMEAAQKIVEGKKSLIDQNKKELVKLGGKIHAEKMVNGGYNALSSEISFKYETALDKGEPKAQKLKKQLDEYRSKFESSKETLKQLVTLENEKKKELAELQKELIEAEKQLDDVVGAKYRMMTSIEKTKINPIMILRNLPFIDYLDPSLKIQQVVLTNITDDRYFQHVPKVDRCTTCHTFIDQAGFEDQKNPYKTHPKLELMVGMNSPHPLKSYGCTTCHGGEGHRVNDFQAIAHTPQNEKQEKEWVEKYNWRHPHKVMQPMHKLQNTEASCLKCHQGVELIPQSTVLNGGRDEIKENGCYACHKIEGWEHHPKPGPALTKVASKLTKNFAKNWVWQPTSFNKHAKMPSFFNQSNNDEPEFKKKTIAEVNTIVEFIWEKSKTHQPFMEYKAGDPERGKELISEVGCLGCHQAEGLDDKFQKAKNRRGPYLTGLGSKVDPNWLVSWLMKPHDYDPRTIMPSFRLTPDEANHIATYLLSLKNEKFKEKVFENLDKNTRDELLLEYFSAFDTEEVAKKKLLSMNDHQRTMELGERSVGKYGCFSCHDIDGFEGRAPIGPELSKVGSKPVEQFGFGHEHIPHERDAWIKAHLKNPRRWDHGVPKSFKDLLRMPKFQLTDKEIQSITVALLGQVGERVPLAGIKRLNANESIAEQGAKVISKKNCMGCHKVDGIGGEILKNYEEDLNEGPPFLAGEGHRVRADWFHDFLDNVHPIRPWLKIRMPSFKFTNEERNAVVSYFQAKSDQVTFEEDLKKLTWVPGEKEAAVELFNKLQCTTCHTQGFNKEPPTAPDLHGVGKRLRPSWIEKWLKNPQGIIPYTAMPAFWEGGQSPEPTILGGDSEKQIKALTKYILELGK